METQYIIISIVVVIFVMLLVMKKGGGSSVPESPPDGTTNDDILELAKQGRKIQAIKWYRAIHHVGLKEAKEAVEGMLKNQN